MTREEAIYELKNAAWLGTDHSRARTEEAVEMAIQALSQEPCDDAVSREAVLQAVSEGCQEWRGLYGRCEELINALPSVTQKSGKWIDYRDDGFVECPFCGHATNCEDNIDELHYCFYCGARMVEPQESEDKE